MPRVSAARAGGVTRLAGVGSLAARAAVWALPGGQNRPNCPVGVAPVMLHIRRVRLLGGPRRYSGLQGDILVEANDVDGMIAR